VHYLVADQAGGVAVIEFLAGRMTVHRGDALPVPVLTNSRYDDSLANLQQYVGFGGTTPIPTSSGSLSRFVRAADLVSRYGPQESRPIIDYAFAILSSVAQSSTQWTIVYDLTDRKVYFRTRQSPEIRHFRTDGLDLLCRTAPNILDVNVTAAGDVYELFQPYTRAANRDLIYTAYRGTDWLSNTPDAVIDALAALPESFPCCRPKPWTDKTRILPPLQSRKKQ
jgi:choloylglycine hydrolase